MACATPEETFPILPAQQGVGMGLGTCELSDRACGHCRKSQLRVSASQCLGLPATELGSKQADHVKQLQSRQTKGESKAALNPDNLICTKAEPEQIKPRVAAGMSHSLLLHYQRACGSALLRRESGMSSCLWIALSLLVVPLGQVMCLFLAFCQ